MCVKRDDFTAGTGAKEIDVDTTNVAQVGAEVDMVKGWSAFGQLGKQMASDYQQDVSGQFGVKHSW